VEVGIGIRGRGRGEANLLDVGRDGGEGEDLEAEDVDAVLRVVLHLVLLFRVPLTGGTGGWALPDHEPASHHRALSQHPPRGPLLRSPPVRKDAPGA
jgi:hypothetical protein